MTFWPFSSSFFSKKTLRSEFGNNRADDTFSPDAKIIVKGLPFYSLLRTWRSPANLSPEMCTQQRLVCICLARTIKKKKKDVSK